LLIQSLFFPFADIVLSSAKRSVLWFGLYKGRSLIKIKNNTGLITDPENRMVLNVSKPKTMCIGSKQKLCTSSDEIFDISINGHQINECQCEKVLGVFVDVVR
jgi:hypothetical protein